MANSRPYELTRQSESTPKIVGKTTGDAQNYRSYELGKKDPAPSRSRPARPKSSYSLGSR